MLGSAALNTVGGLLTPKPQTVLSDLHLMSSAQQALYNQMVQQAMNGSGEWGYGAAAKQGTGQVNQFLADRGISADSGIGYGMQANAFGAASQADQEARRQQMLGLLGSPLQVASASGANFVTGSPSVASSGRSNGGGGGNMSVFGANAGEQATPYSGGSTGDNGWGVPNRRGSGGYA
jgi:hypothetical protein